VRAQQHRQVVSPEPVGTVATVISESERPLLGRRVEAAMTDEMQHVPAAMPHRVAQVPPGLARNPVQLDPPSPLKTA
jgi:hypothetical protein